MKTKDVILKALETPGTPAHVSTNTNIKHQTVEKALQRLFAAGKVSRDEHGVYSLPKQHKPLSWADQELIRVLEEFASVKNHPGIREYGEWRKRMLNPSVLDEPLDD